MKKILEQAREMSVAELEAEVRRHNRLYFSEHHPEMSDEEFDRLVELLRERAPNSSVLGEIESDVTPGAKKIRHVVPMLSLDKCYDEKSLLHWASKFEGETFATPKIDGVAIALRYNAQGKLIIGATRGNGVEGEDITDNIRTISQIPQVIALKNVEIRGEVYMPLSVFEKYRETFSNPRNLAAGAIKQKDPKKTASYHLSFFAYDLLGSNAHTEEEKRAQLKRERFPILEGSVVLSNDMQKVYEQFLAKRTRCNFETDGVVFRANRLSEQERLGFTAHHPRYAIAYKFQGDSGVTRLLDVEWSVSRTGAITPVGIVDPVELSGAMVKRASLHNIGMMEKLEVTKNARVMMTRRGGVIPNLELVVEKGKGKFQIPEKCPSCGAATERIDDFLYCTRPEKCIRSKVGELAHFVAVLEIDGFGEKLLGRLYEHGVVTDPAEFFELTLDELLRMERMGETLGRKLLRNIDARQQVSLEVFLRSLGIREVGKHASKILAGYGDIKKLFSLTEDELSTIHTVGPVIAREVVQGLREKRPLIEKLLKHMKIIKPIKRTEQAGLLAGKSILFTGKLLMMGRKEAEKLSEQKGATVASGVSRTLDFLVVGDGGGAGSKLEKAKALIQQGEKIRILSEREFLGIINHSTQ